MSTSLTLILAISLAPLVILGAFVLSSSNFQPGRSRVGRVDRASRPRPTDSDVWDGERGGWWCCEEGFGVDVEGLRGARNVFDGCDYIGDSDGDGDEEGEEGEEGVLRWVVEGFAGFVERVVVGAEEEEEEKKGEEDENRGERGFHGIQILE
ncbi:MAG: hypothetical protein M1840_008997 [Geoglossum simile]|nr:MAG: hypothetical protein M1840_008997 [Geoglossum simile]